MRPAPRPANETSRLKALLDSEALSKGPSPLFARIARSAARFADTQVGLVTFIGADRQWVKASVGCDFDAQDRDSAFCAWAVYNAELLWVEDAAADPRFAGNPLVQGHPHIRHYAGAPIVMPQGYMLGAVCVIDGAPRPFDPRVASQLTGLAEQVSRALRRRAPEKVAA